MEVSLLLQSVFLFGTGVIGDNIMTIFSSTDKPIKEPKRRVSTKEWKAEWLKCLKNEIKKYQNGNEKEPTNHSQTETEQTNSQAE